LSGTAKVSDFTSGSRQIASKLRSYASGRNRIVIRLKATMGDKEK
jgi:hypothetical protein